jgi:DnaJ-class molecular chaperone
MENFDYYQELGVSIQATAPEIKEAYRKLAFEFHPDRNEKKPDSAEKMKRINEAYAVLSNAEKRREYDTMRQQFGASATGHFRSSYSQQDIFKGSDVQQMFEEVARAFGLRGVDEIFKDFYGPGYRTFSVKRPGFTFSGFMFSGKGGAAGEKPKGGLLGRIPRMLLGGLFGSKLPQDGADYSDTIHVPEDMAREGGPYAYLHRRLKKKLIVKIPPGTRDTQRIRLGGMGEPGKHGGKSGDLYLEVRIKKSLGRKMKEMFRGGRWGLARKGR